MTIKLTHLGAKNCVTGSCHLVQTRPDSTGGINILVDCGTAQGIDPLLPFDRFPVRIENIPKKQMKKMIEPLKEQLQNLQSSEKSALEGLIQIPFSSNSANESSLTPCP